MDVVLPNWLDQVQGVDFTPEKEMLSELEHWASADGWEVSDGRSLSFELRQRTDVLIDQPKSRRRLRVAVLSKSKGSPGAIRIDASTHRIFELVYQPKNRRWRVETAAVPLSDDLQKEGWAWFTNLAFRP
jgi:hypothetical protein